MTPDVPTTLDHFLGGALTLRQPASGHRSGTDAILLAAAVGGAPDRLIDLGAVDVVYGHSSHHPLPVEVYCGKVGGRV